MSYRKKFIVEPGEKIYLTKLTLRTPASTSLTKSAAEDTGTRSRMDKLQYLLYADAISHCWCVAGTRCRR